jgi:hypothetical protein
MHPLERAHGGLSRIPVVRGMTVEDIVEVVMVLLLHPMFLPWP